MKRLAACLTAVLLMPMSASGQASPLSDRLQRGEVSDKDIMLAAYLGEDDAIAICSSRALPTIVASDSFESWLLNLDLHGREAITRAHVALINSSLSFWTDAHPQDDRLEAALHDLEAHLAGEDVERSLRAHLGALEPLWQTLTTLAATEGIEHWRDIYVLERMITGLRYAQQMDVWWIGNDRRARPLANDAARRAIAEDLLPFVRREGDPIRARVAARQR